MLVRTRPWHLIRLAAFALFGAAPLAGAAHAQTAPAASGPTVYALVVASNEAAPGQQRLQYAERDAEQVTDTLISVGRYPKASIRTLLHPSREALLGELEALAVPLSAAAARGEQSQFFFYYSGHAKAEALLLGTEELDLATLRERLQGLPSTLSIVVLDACQSGAFSRVKGAQAAADFSFNSVARLNNEGLVVLASSTGAELSQESDELRGSYFTHNFVTALRGAADTNADGQVTLGEAYRYAYDQTLVATTQTAVGSQHPTLETELRGKGEVPLSYPAQADSSLELPAGLHGRVLVQQLPGQTVVAELYKAAGKALQLGLSAGAYRVFLADAGQRARCQLHLVQGGATPLVTGLCERVVEDTGQAKGELPPRDEPVSSKHLERREILALELGAGFGKSHDDRYVNRLGDFGFSPGGVINTKPDTLAWRYALSALYSPVAHVALVLDFQPLDDWWVGRSQAPTTSQVRYQTFSFTTHALALHVRATTSTASATMRGYVQLGAGLGWARTHYSEDVGPDYNQLMQVLRKGQTFTGPYLAATAGVQMMPVESFGFFVQASYSYAPLIDNLLGDVHDSGGVTFLVGLRIPHAGAR